MFKNDEQKVNYAEKRRRGLMSSKTPRVAWKSKSRHIA